MKTKPRIEINLEEVEEYAYRGMTHQQIADALGISERTLRNRKKDFADFAAAIKKGKARGLSVASGMLQELIADGSLGAIIFYLKAQGGWKEASDLNINGNMKTSSETVRLTEAEIKRALDARIAEREREAEVPEPTD